MRKYSQFIFALTITTAIGLTNTYASTYVACTEAETSAGTCFECGATCAARLTPTGESVTYEQWNGQKQAYESITTAAQQLTISGTGAMDDYAYSTYDGTVAPWSSVSGSITSVVVEDGITKVGSRAFYPDYGVVRQSNISTLTIPDSVKIINGGEYEDKGFKQFCAVNGIKMQKTIPGTPQQNGVAERMNKTLNKRARSMRLHAGLPKTFWADAVSTGAYLINRGPSVPLGHRLPEEVWSGKEVNLSHLKVFGCVSYVYIKSDARSKLDAKSKKCYFIGYGDEAFGYRFWDDQNRKIIRSRNVTFNEMAVFKDGSNAESVNAESKVESLILSAWMRFLTVQLKEGIQKLMRIQKLNKILKLKKLKNNRLSREHLQRLSEGLPEPLDLHSVIHPPCSIFC